MKIGSLFAGIGGFDLAARWMGWTTAWFAEIEPYASAVLREQWPDVPNHGDIRSISGRDVEPVDLLCGGFPCQDISLIGRGEGLAGSRSGLWSEFVRLIGELRPAWVVAENVPALRRRGLDRILRDLDALGYDAEWHCIPASYVGASHRRDRIWIVAHAVRARLEGHAGDGPAQRETQPHGSISAARLRGRTNTRRWWAVEPDVGRVAHGIPARVDRLRCLGNAIVPQVAYILFQAIEADRSLRAA